MFTHYGLYFTEEHVRQAQQSRTAEPYAAAWALLDTYSPPDDVARAQHGGLRYRFVDDLQAGEAALDALYQAITPTAGQPQTTLTEAATLMILAQSFEMLRDHPARHDQSVWLEAFTTRLYAAQRPLADLPFVDHVWLNTLNLVSSIVLEQEDMFQQAVGVFRQIIDHDIHPEGYILKTVELPETAPHGDGHGLSRMLLSAQALILAAEAASHVGTDLWEYHNRGVSALTPLPYLLYYYYYPEKWRWDEELESEPAEALYRQHAGMWDMAQRRAVSRDRTMLLDELRPIYDVWGGGLTTLTHGGSAEMRKRRGWFG